MKKKGKHGGSPKGDINVTPFIDILLVLIVIFMTITPLTPHGLNAEIPQPPPRDQVPKENPETAIVVGMEATGVLSINQQPIDRSALSATLQEMLRTRKDRVMFINAHPDLLYDDVVRIIDISKASGADKIGLMTQKLLEASQ